MPNLCPTFHHPYTLRITKLCKQGDERGSDNGNIYLPTSNLLQEFQKLCVKLPWGAEKQVENKKTGKQIELAYLTSMSNTNIPKYVTFWKSKFHS